jgi:hypothetical protein
MNKKAKSINIAMCSSDDTGGHNTGEATHPTPSTLQKKQQEKSLLAEGSVNALTPSEDIEPSQTRNRRPGKVNLELVAELLAKGCTHGQIAKVCGCSRQAVGYLAKHHGLGDVEHFREHRGALLAAKQAQLLEHGLTPEKMAKMSPRDAAISFGVLFDKERLETGKSTQNMAHSFAKLVEESCRETPE